MTYDLGTAQKPTWCPGCANFVTLAAIKRALSELHSEGSIDLKKTAIVADIGCGAKIYDYINLSAFYSLHGRVIPTAMGIKAGNPDITVIGFGGDGGTYDEGMSHLVHASKSNPNITMIVGNNRVFALTKGQPTSSEITEPLSIAAAAGATFLARGSAFEIDHLVGLMKQAIIHKGFSFLEIIEPCLIFKNDASDISSKTSRLKDPEEPIYSIDNLDRLHKTDGSIPVGIFRKSERNIWEDSFRR